MSVYASKSSLPGDCHVANACPARSIATSPLWLKTVTCGLFLRHFVPPRRAHNDKALRSFGWFIIRVRSSSFLLRVISRLMPLNDKSVRSLLSLPPRGKVDCRRVAKARRMRGKRRYVFIRFYSPHSPLGSLRSAVSHRGRAGWRVFVSDISLPGDCHVTATSRLVA